ncbi:NUDIX hydrolase [Lacticaseibacillus casei]|uniref:NUDIX hydrolase N-terminal domain-containing protein n=1 Tax=Lacticaseibacillus huelsenbergensis TaxID=3035291 RepID=A0ABY8DU35_9LACO|nr:MULTISPECIES: NUDIX hydrolase N-terminal domain-containing protein [Lacticaseibacillus]MDG3062520.1 NUDIX hydrolase N-terminal domain-containing protein [Lacticaseibacillus sp. BCRC 81376]QVI36614.1 NUDIX hydrolase N-terminal domain-containing protein [Lacticaseibacillus casei]QXG58407.1 NUDIX hydrolase [Lacticaseibacillus casei]WFB40127.1 NUDIX hydrolase N-terminal domain-containing protein [Lacticaseibacillus huelsenbergensis]WFB41859.1 NUDIX hydrolase N-terminal domain-containing protein
MATKDLNLLIAQLQAIAQSGCYYTKDVFDRERYDQLAAITKQLVMLLGDATPEQARLFVDQDIGYVTPKVDVRAVTFIDDRLLMVQERAGETWSIPGGWADLGYSASEIAVKETREEAGLTVKPTQLLAVYSVRKRDYAPQSTRDVYKFFIACEPVTNALKTGIETENVKTFSREEALALPLSLQRNLPADIAMAFAAHVAEYWETQFD